MRPRTESEMEDARLALRLFNRAGYRLFPLRGKVPRDDGWQDIEYPFAHIGAHMRRGGNAGVALQGDDIVLDVDPRNFVDGDNPFERLCRDLGTDFSDYPSVLSGRGEGHHIYMKKPRAMRVRSKLADYPGLDFLGAGRYVVAPGSLHPKTGQPYEADLLGPSIDEVDQAPGKLLELLARTDAVAATSSAGEFGIITDEQLAEMLEVLDPVDYGKGKHDEWFRLACACYDATAGDGLEVFLDWCAGDAVYADEHHQESVRSRWSTMAWERPGDTTYRTLFKAVSAAGRPGLVAVADAIDEDFIVHEFEETDDG